MRRISSPTQSKTHGKPLLYRQRQDQLGQWVKPKDQRHLQGFAEMLSAILQSGSVCLGKGFPT
ncbi:hypothetical protein DO97_14500 [Neosynechococcus sphagnicola sy1]|uniref:Uncharacterized protein n=1 Tax=Neosynechococcus sphagnicola sy1 TaxID=1497020 RepID=A0A098TIP8_9CYAN|nr:hypothetical protein DO97_14500 [Neosynechococcus sphagnicola sy1]